MGIDELELLKEKVDSLTDVTKRLLETCHYLENVNAYLLGKVSLAELKASMQSIDPPISKEPTIIAVWIEYLQETIDKDLNDIDLSYMLGSTLEDISKARKKLEEQQTIEDTNKRIRKGEV